MKPGTQIQLPDGRYGTVVYNSLIGAGIKFGLHDLPPGALDGTDGNTVTTGAPDGFEWEPDALLRDPWDGCERYGFRPSECVGTDFTVIKEGSTGEGN